MKSSRFESIIIEPQVTTYGYDKVGNRTSLQLPNGAFTGYTYDAMNRLTKLQSWLPSVAVGNRDDAHAVMVQIYTVGPTGRRDAVHEVFRDDTNAVTADTTTTWTYDNLDRLINEAVNYSFGGTSYFAHYTYDLVGNRTRKTTNQPGQAPQVDYVYDGNAPQSDDRLMTETGSGGDGTASYTTTYFYDNNGSLKTKTRTGSKPENNSYAYDIRNRMTGATVTLNPGTGTESTTTTAYTYDPGGLRASTAVGATITQFVEDSNNPTGYGQVDEELTATTHVVNTSYVIGSEVLGQKDATGIVWFLADGHDSTRLMTDATGNLLRAGTVANNIIRNDYDAFGNGTTFDAATSRTKILYTGQQFDAGVKMYNLRARFYDPAIGRFPTEDPFRGNTNDPMSLHKYFYANGNPINGFDPSGNSFIDTLGAATISAGLFAMDLGTKSMVVGAAGLVGYGIQYAAINICLAMAIEQRNMPEILTYLRARAVAQQSMAASGAFLVGGFMLTLAGSLLVTGGQAIVALAASSAAQGVPQAGAALANTVTGGRRAATTFEEFNQGRDLVGDEAQTAWRVYQQAASAQKGILIGHDNAAIEQAYDGWQALRLTSWTRSVNMAWIDGAIDAGLPVKLVTTFDNVRRTAPNGDLTITWQEILRVISRGGQLMAG